ncbi:MAG: hypothetical protein RL722_326 [Pseudomonadota bacterium]|jgi:LysR family transcriptional activator of nhaA
MSTLNYRHLHYFWVVAKAGGVSRGAARLGMAVQTVSAQVRELEQALGHALFKPAGRGLALTEAGQAALQQAEQIFALGEQLPALVREAGSSPGLRLAVGISDGLDKLLVRRLLAPVLDEPQLRLVCHEGEFDELLAELALHKLDVVLADRPAPPHRHLRVYSHALGQAPLAWYGAARWADRPLSGSGLLAGDEPPPLLLPTAHAAVRSRLDAWFDRQGLRPRIVGEFEDSALLATFGAAGLGVFPAPALIEAKLARRYELTRLGEVDGVTEEFYAIATEKKVQHRLLQRLVRPDRLGEADAA